jgi:hypothetical protein
VITGFVVFLVLSVLFSGAYCCMWLVARRNREREAACQRQFDRSMRGELADLEQRMPESLRVIGGARRGPDPAETRSRR